MAEEKGGAGCVPGLCDKGADCGTRMEVRIAGGVVQPTVGLAHFAVPARRWWDDIVFT
jgi:hypothetical protein